MKTLTVLILLLPLTAWSQYPPSQALPDAYYLRDNLKRTDTTEGFYPITTLEPLVSKDELQYRVFIPRLLSDWKAYMGECWADSTLTGVFYMFPDSGETEVRHIYGHHHDPTLPGFMLYLERKYQMTGVKP